MLTITKTQMQMFNSLARRRFEASLRSHIESGFPTQCAAMGASELQAYIASGVDHAARYNIVSRTNVALFVDLLIAISPEPLDSERFDWVRDILGKSNLHEATRMKLIYLHMAARAPEVDLSAAAG
jgi:hypothetical protein